MIGCILPAPTEPGDTPAATFVPLRYDYGRSGDWIPVEQPGVPFATEIAAARACVAYLQRLWPTVESGAKIMLAMTEHPDFDFNGGAFDADTVRDAARTLAERVDRFDADIARLLDAPEPRDPVYINSARYRHNPATGHLEPATDSEGGDDGDDGGPEGELTKAERAGVAAVAMAMLMELPSGSTEAERAAAALLGAEFPSGLTEQERQGAIAAAEALLEKLKKTSASADDGTVMPVEDPPTPRVVVGPTEPTEPPDDDSDR